MAENLSNLYTRAPVSVAEEYPDVPSPDPPLSPFLLAARWQSRELYGEDMPKVAADLLECGYDSPALRRLAGEILVHSSSDVEPLVTQAFRELGVAFPLSEIQARMVSTRQVAREVIAGLRNPWAAGHTLEFAVWNRDAPDETISALFSINDEINWDPQYRRSLDKLDRDLLDVFARLARLNDSDIARTNSHS